MKAIIFAAGLGTRLRPLTNDRPKALVEVGGVPMLERVARRLIAAGCDDITVNVHHFAQKVIDFLAAKEHFGVTMHVSDERDLLLDTGGGILKARQWLDGNEPFVVHNADILTTVDLGEMVESHRRSGAMATLLVKDRSTSRYLLFDREQRMRGWTNRSTGEVKPAGLNAEGLNLRAFGGVHVLSPQIFALLEKYDRLNGPKFSTMPFYIDICTEHYLRGYEPDAPYLWLDVGKPDTLKQAQELVANDNNL